MARSTAEIQAEIAVTRRLIEHQLDDVRRRVPNPRWAPYALLGGALVVGLVASRISVLKVLGAGARAVEAGFAVFSTVATVRRYFAERPPSSRKAA